MENYPNRGTWEGKFQILALDGGGIKGVFIAALLAAVEEDLSIDITSNFDLIAGTSTGGIIAVGLGLGLSPRRILEFYLAEGPRIFSNWLGIRSALRLLMSKFPARRLRQALQADDVFGERLFGESIKRLVIPSYDLGSNDVYLFRTPHHEHLRRDWKVPAWKVVMSTTAAPTYLPAFRGLSGTRLIDGGVWANNPTMVAVAEAVSVLGANLENVSVFSIGTTDECKQNASTLNNGGLVDWAVDAVGIIMRSQSIGIYNQTRHLLGDENVLRLDPQVPPSVFTLDGIKVVEDLVALAHVHSRKVVPEYNRRFANHVASHYTPHYTPAEMTSKER
jgi:uncharacterized protein